MGSTLRGLATLAAATLAFSAAATFAGGRRSPQALLSASAPLPAADFDEFGGLKLLPSSAPANGFFHTEKFGNRWMLVTPRGNAFWMLGVQDIGDYSFNAHKYSSKNQWAVQVHRRLRSWGFNTVGEYATPSVDLVGGDNMPFMFLFRPSSNAIRNSGGFAHEAIKEIYSNISGSIYNGYRGILVDAFDPAYQSYADAFFNSDYNLAAMPGLARNPWLIGYATEDGDEWFGVSGGYAPDSNVLKPHAGWAVLVSADPMLATATPSTYPAQKYSDLNNYSKQELRDFLKTRYNGDIAALNAAWHSNYTSWNHDGGYRTGSGFLDEGGQHSWVAAHLPADTPDWNRLASMTDAARRDLDSYLELFAGKLASVAVNAIHGKDTHHLIFSPDAMNQWGYQSDPAVLRGIAKWFDVIVAGYQEGPVYRDQRRAAPAATFGIAGKPMIMWVGFTANADSAMEKSGNPFGVDASPNQADRGRKYADYLLHLFNDQDSKGDHPVVGIDFWGWQDMYNEHANWGLVTGRDNAYDGREDVVALGKDAWGFNTGGEARDYGDFLTAVRETNYGVFASLLPSRVPPNGPGRQ